MVIKFYYIKIVTYHRGHRVKKIEVINEKLEIVHYQSLITLNSFLINIL